MIVDAHEAAILPGHDPGEAIADQLWISGDQEAVAELVECLDVGLRGDDVDLVAPYHLALQVEGEVDHLRRCASADGSRGTGRNHERP